MARLLLVLICSLAAASSALAKPSVTSVRIGEHPDKTRFVLELDEAPAYRAFTLPDPFRVVIDLPALDWNLEPVSMLRQGGVIQALRYGLFAPGTSRVVLDVKVPVAFKNVFVLPAAAGRGHRLVIDLVAVDRAAYFAAPRQPILSDPPLPIAQQAALPLAPARPDDDPRPMIAIDAGHGGVDPGAISRSGLHEKDLVLAYAKALKRALEASGRYRAHLVRDHDVFIRLRDRILQAHKAGADLFISLHANTHKRARIRGFSVYTLSENASDAEAAALAAKENKADVIAGIDLTDQTEVVSKILIDLAQRETMNQSKTFANMMVGEVGRATSVLSNTHRSAGFAVLKSPTVPSVLVELGYLSNKVEERELKSKPHRDEIIKAIKKAIDRYFDWQQQSARR